MEKLSQIHRDELIRDICSVYTYNTKGKRQLCKKTDAALFAFRESLRKRGKIKRFLVGSFSVHINVLLKETGATTYEINTTWENNKEYTIIYLGFNNEYQVGYLKLNDQWKIVEAQIHDKIVNRFNGREVIIEGKMVI